MNKKEVLIKRFYKRFCIELPVCAVAVIGMAILFVFGLLDYLQTKQVITLCLSIACFVIFMGFLIAAIKNAVPLVSDFICVRRNLFKEITGTVVYIEEEEQGGDPPTTKYNPVVKDETTGEEVKLDISGEIEKIHKNCRYGFLYLPNTKFAIVERTFSFFDSTAD